MSDTTNFFQIVLTADILIKKLSFSKIKAHLSQVSASNWVTLLTTITLTTICFL